MYEYHFLYYDTYHDRISCCHLNSVIGREIIKTYPKIYTAKYMSDIYSIWHFFNEWAE